MIIHELSKDESVEMEKLLDIAEDKDKLDEVIRGMININVVRYGMDGKIKWHGRVQQKELHNPTVDIAS